MHLCPFLARPSKADPGEMEGALGEIAVLAGNQMECNEIYISFIEAGEWTGWGKKSNKLSLGIRLLESMELILSREPFVDGNEDHEGINYPYDCTE